MAVPFWTCLSTGHCPYFLPEKSHCPSCRQCEEHRDAGVTHSAHPRDGPTPTSQWQQSCEHSVGFEVSQEPPHSPAECASLGEGSDGAPGQPQVTEGHSRAGTGWEGLCSAVPCFWKITVPVGQENLAGRHCKRGRNLFASLPRRQMSVERRNKNLFALMQQQTPGISQLFTPH